MHAVTGQGRSGSGVFQRGRGVATVAGGVLVDVELPTPGISGTSRAQVRLTTATATWWPATSQSDPPACETSQAAMSGVRPATKPETW